MTSPVVPLDEPSELPPAYLPDGGEALPKHPMRVRHVRSLLRFVDYFRVVTPFQIWREYDAAVGKHFRSTHKNIEALVRRRLLKPVSLAAPGMVGRPRNGFTLTVEGGDVLGIGDRIRRRVPLKARRAALFAQQTEMLQTRFAEGWRLAMSKRAAPYVKAAGQARFGTVPRSEGEHARRELLRQGLETLDRVSLNILYRNNGSRRDPTEIRIILAAESMLDFRRVLRGIDPIFHHIGPSVEVVLAESRMVSMAVEEVRTFFAGAGLQLDVAVVSPFFLNSGSVPHAADARQRLARRVAGWEPWRSL